MATIPLRSSLRATLPSAMLSLTQRSSNDEQGDVSATISTAIDDDALSANSRRSRRPRLQISYQCRNVDIIDDERRRRAEFRCGEPLLVCTYCSRVIAC